MVVRKKRSCTHCGARTVSHPDKSLVLLIEYFNSSLHIKITGTGQYYFMCTFMLMCYGYVMVRIKAPSGVYSGLDLDVPCVWFTMIGGARLFLLPQPRQTRDGLGAVVSTSPHS